MAPSQQVKEEFYIRRLFDDDVPLFVDATRYARQQAPYPLSAKRALKGTCASWPVTLGSTTRAPVCAAMNPVNASFTASSAAELRMVQ